MEKRKNTKTSEVKKIVLFLDRLRFLFVLLI